DVSVEHFPALLKATHMIPGLRTHFKHKLVFSTGSNMLCPSLTPSSETRMQTKLIVLSVLLMAMAPQVRGATVTLKKLVEKREVTTEKDSFSDKGIELTVHIDGPDVQGARKFGKLTVTKA